MIAESWDVLIVGGGPAGLSAAIYSGRALRRTLVVEKKIFGGQIINADVIENYPGFAEPIVPADLMEQFSLQAKRYGVVLENDEVTRIEKASNRWQVETLGGRYSARSIIYAAGSVHRFLNVAGEKQLLGRGVSVCATCDAPFFLNRKVAVIGGGDTALAEALHLSKFAAAVHVIHRRDELRAEKILQERAFKNEKIVFVWDSVVTGFIGREKLTALEIRNVKTGQSQPSEFDGAFLAIGTIPHTELIKDFTRLDDQGYVPTDISLKTDSPGLFVAGEVIKGNRRQVIISAGMGVQAALSCEEYLVTQD